MFHIIRSVDVNAKDDSGDLVLHETFYVVGPPEFAGKSDMNHNQTFRVSGSSEFVGNIAANQTYQIRAESEGKLLVSSCKMISFKNFLIGRE